MAPQLCNVEWGRHFCSSLSPIPQTMIWSIADNDLHPARTQRTIAYSRTSHAVYGNPLSVQSRKKVVNRYDMQVVRIHQPAKV